MECMNRSDELTRSLQGVNMKVDSKDLNRWLLPLRSFMYVDTDMTGESNITVISLATQQQPTGKLPRHARLLKARVPYKRYASVSD